MGSQALAEEVRPLLLKNSPTALAVGFRCIHQGHGFYLPPYQHPVRVTPPNRTVKHEVCDNLPDVVEPTTHSVVSGPGYGWSGGCAGTDQSGHAGLDMMPEEPSALDRMVNSLATTDSRPPSDTSTTTSAPTN